jgi:hypothetical protein
MVEPELAPDGAQQPPVDPAALPMPLSRRRLALIAAGLVGAWLLVAFGRQVGDASAASTRAGDLRSTNADLRSELTALQADLRHVAEDPYVGIEARRYGLGIRHEVPFVLAGDAPSLPPDAPGSATQRVGADLVARSPIEAWLDLLFGPGR